MAIQSTPLVSATNSHPFNPRPATGAESELKAAIDNLERCLLTPVVPGAIPAWVADVQHAWREAGAQIHFSLKPSHPRQFEEIAAQDPELLPRIELLKAEDVAIEAERGNLNERFVRMAEEAPSFEPDEEKAKNLLESVIDDAMALILRVRKQHVSLQTWYVEAFNRDRGTVD